MRTYLLHRLSVTTIERSLIRNFGNRHRKTFRGVYQMQILQVCQSRAGKRFVFL